MIGDFGDRNLKKSENTPRITPENWTKFRKLQETAAQEALDRVGAKLETHNLLVLVDLQGMYLGLHKWLSERRFPIDGGLILSRFAFFQIHDVFQRIRASLVKSRGREVLDFESLLLQIEQAGTGGMVKVRPDATYLRVVPQFELFYAPAPLADIEWQLRKQAKAGSVEARSQLTQIQKGVLKHHYFERDYAAYDDFVSKLKANPEYSKSEKGFFNYYVGPSGLKVFDEKEVDTRIVIRAMDAFYNYEADSLCIVSSDQDFMPLHVRSRDFGVQSYQADLANFKVDSRIGRKLRELGSNFLPGRIDPIWPLQIITEAVSSAEMEHLARYMLAENEFVELCKMHNEMNDFHVSLEILPDGRSSMKISKPAR